MVPRVMYGKGAFNQLALIINPKRTEAPFVFLVDDVFRGDFWVASRMPLESYDKVIAISTKEEPKTGQVDDLVTEIKTELGRLPAGVVGIGGGSILDLAKAVAIMLTNEGKTEDYQGWDLVSKPGVYHLGVPTISGTGAEVSRTAVLTGTSKKLGINSDYTPFDQVCLDPELTKNVPKSQWFYTGMDCFVHSVESLNGTFINGFSQAYAEKALALCKDVFLGIHNLAEEAREKLMMASWMGGMSIAYSQVGVAHALSYGLSYMLGVKHGIGNCMVFDHLEEYYPEEVFLFKEMKDRHEIELPRGVCANLTEEDMDSMIYMALSMGPLWENALGKDWRRIITARKVRSIYEKL